MSWCKMLHRSTKMAIRGSASFDGAQSGVCEQSDATVARVDEKPDNETEDAAELDGVWKVSFDGERTKPAMAACSRLSCCWCCSSSSDCALEWSVSSLLPRRSRAK